jgi:hypothetical protein
VFLFYLDTDRAIEWARENVATEPHHWVGWGAIAVEHRFAADIAGGLQAAGMVVR